MSEKPGVGTIGWRDLTVEDADTVRDFYATVVGWESQGIDMGGYEDYAMVPASGSDAVAGICHARGSNAKVPPQWLVYITVEDVDESARRAAEQGGAVIDGPRDMGGGRFAVIRDPAGAVCALYAPAE